MKEKYSVLGKIPEKYVSIFDLTRRARHKTQYGGRIEMPENEAEDAIHDALEFHSFIEKIIEKK